MPTELLNVSQNIADRVFAARYAPILRFDALEPFLPLAAGYTLFRESGPSPSFRQGFTVDLTPPYQPPAALAIEYAIWWDWDIGHLYELEHVWVYVGADERVTRVAASWHGDFHDMRYNGALALEGDHPVLLSEPGKHAFAPTPDWFHERRKKHKRSETRDLAGVDGILRAPYIRDQVKATPLKTRLVHTYLAQHAFEPSWDFSQRFPLTAEMLVPWPALRDWMPGRINAILDTLLHEIAPGEYRPLRVGHRGAAAYAPHNTRLSLRRAADLGADMVEFDVQITGDNQVVLAHDPYLVAEDGRIWPIRRCALAELRTVDLGQGEHLLTFAEAIDVCQEEQLGACIELKDGAVVPAVVQTLKAKKYGGHCILSSFRPDWLAEVRAANPDLLTSVLFSSTHVDPVLLAQSVGASYVSPCWERLPDPASLLTPDWIARVRAADLGIVCWHEERPEQIAALRRLGVDAICSDKPELLR